MVEVTAKIVNKLGIHARPASLFVQTASKFKSDVVVVKDGMEVNGKSIMDIMILACEPGCEVTIRTEGEDEREAATALEKLIQDKFYEE